MALLTPEKIIQKDAVERCCQDLAYNMASAAFPRWNYGLVADQLSRKLRKALPELVLRLAKESLENHQKGEKNGQNFPV